MNAEQTGGYGTLYMRVPIGLKRWMEAQAQTAGLSLTAWLIAEVDHLRGHDQETPAMLAYGHSTPERRSR